MSSPFNVDLMYARRQVEAARREVEAAQSHLYLSEMTQINLEFQLLRNLPRFYDVPHQICKFAKQVGDSLTAVRNMGKPEYLCSPSVMTCLVKKMPPMMRCRWHTFFANSHPEVRHLGLMLIHDFLGHEYEVWSTAPNGYWKENRRKEGVQRPIAKRRKKRKVRRNTRNLQKVPVGNSSKMSELATVKTEPGLPEKKVESANPIAIKVEAPITIKKETADAADEAFPTSSFFLRHIKVEKVDDDDETAFY